MSTRFLPNQVIFLLPIVPFVWHSFKETLESVKDVKIHFVQSMEQILILLLIWLWLGLRDVLLEIPLDRLWLLERRQCVTTTVLSHVFKQWCLTYNLYILCDITESLDTVDIHHLMYTFGIDVVQFTNSKWLDYDQKTINNINNKVFWCQIWNDWITITCILEII